MGPTARATPGRQQPQRPQSEPAAERPSTGGPAARSDRRPTPRPRRGRDRDGALDLRVAGRPPTERAVTAAPLVVTGDLELLDGILAVAAAAGVEPTVTAEVGSVRPSWTGAPMVLVGADRARQLADLVLPRRGEVYVVGQDAERDELWRWSVPLGAAVVGLPEGAGMLTAAMADVTGRRIGSGRVVGVVGGSGGAGASSTAAALAVAGAMQGLPTMLVDLDPLGGGIDLLVGAEGVAGWRWPRLEGAQGHLGDLTGHLPRISGLDVLSTAREDDASQLAVDPVKAVLQSATRSHRLVVLDLPRTLDAVTREALRRTDRTVLVTSAEVRGIAAAQLAVDGLREATNELTVVVRKPRVGAVDPGLVSDALGLPLAGVVGEDNSLRHSAERGDPPGRSGRGQLARLSRRLLASLDLEAASA